MRRFHRLLAVLAITSAAGAAAGAPPAAAGGTPREVPRGVLIEKVPCVRDATQTYTLYLPTAYDPERPTPVLLVFDPRGRGTLAADLFRPAAERYGWIVLSSNDTRSDGPWEPNAKAVNAMWPELGLRYTVDPKRIYAAGFSGGAIVAWVLSQETHQVAGIIGASGRLPANVPTRQIDAAHFGTAGEADFNFLEMRRIDDLLAERDVPHRLEIFAGRHQWMPQRLATTAVGWMELLAMRRGLRPADPELVGELFAADLAAAREAESAGEPLTALRRYESIARTYAGLHDTAAVEKAARELAGSRGVAEARRAEARGDKFERQQIAFVARRIDALGDPDRPVSPDLLAGELRLDDLRAKAAAGGYAGAAARRVLEEIYTQTSFYLTREALAAEDYGRARLLLSVALRIHPEAAVPWYNLACAEARLGHSGPALDALAEAFAQGFGDREKARTDPDLASLHDDPRFVALAGAGDPPPAPAAPTPAP